MHWSSSRKKAAIYPLRLCRAILAGIQNHLKAVGWMSDDVVGVMPMDSCGATEEVHNVEMWTFQPEEVAMANDLKRRNRQSSKHGTRTYDALTKQLLDEELVIQGKEVEMQFLYHWTVYEYAEYEEAHAETGRRPISTRWVCTNKGDDINPNVRCRWVAREFRYDQDVIFAATAPYEAIRLLLSITATKEENITYKGKSGGQRLQISLIDVKRAYFNAVVDEPIFVELPPEDPEHGRKCGRLKRHLYGTRGAAAGWEDEYTAFLQDIGFQRGLASGCLFHHPTRDLRVVVYGDDFS